MVRGMVDRGKIGFGVLSWRGYDSLANSLESYERQRLLDLFDEKVLFLPEAGPRGIELARRYGLHEKTTPNNLGILGGFKALASAMNSPIVLLAENDHPLVEDHQESERQIDIAGRYVERGAAHIWRFRHRYILSHITESRPYKSERYWPRADASRSIHFAARLRRWIRPGKASSLAGWTIFTSDDADKRFPRDIRLTPEGDYLVRSRCFPWCNNAFMVRRDFFLQTIIAESEAAIQGRLVNGFPTIETEINRRFWSRGDFWTGIGRGLFAHDRLESRGY